MEFFLNNMVAPIILSYAVIYLWSKLLKEKINYKGIKFWIVLISIAMLGVLNYWITNVYIRIVVNDIFQIGFCKILFNKKLNNCMVTILITRFIILFAEILYSIVFTFIFDEGRNIIIEYGGILLADGIVAAVIFIAVKIKLLHRATSKIMSWLENIKEQYVGAGVLFLLVIINFFGVSPYYEIEFKYSIIFNTFIIIIYSIIYISSLRNKHKLTKVSDRYSTTITSLREYENVLNKYKVSNHEDKNQFLTVRNMLDPKDKKEKKIMDYIDKFIENKIEDDEKVMEQVYVIPEGGLRGLIYSKLVYMKENKINYQFNLDKKVKTTDLIEINDNDILDICKILGVFIDNAIEEVTELEEKSVSIEIYKENKEICFSVTNNYSHPIDLERIEEEGYSTKGNGHGYGLSLVRQLVEKNKNFKNLKQITDNTFTQILELTIEEKTKK